MAAILEERESSADKAALHIVARPDWREKPYSWFLVGLVVANIFFDFLFFRIFADANFAIIVVSFGMLPGQLFLLGLWLAYGGLHFAARFLTVAAAMLHGAAAICLALDVDRESAQVIIKGATILLLVGYAVLVPLRTLLGWRIDFDPAYYRLSPGRAMQLRLKHILLYTAVCALPCALFSWWLPDNPEAAPLLLAYIAMALLACMPVALLVVATDRTWRTWCASAGMLLASILIAVAISQQTLSAEILAGLPAAYIVGMGTVLVNLGLLRLLFGLRLFSIMDPHLAAGTQARSALVEAELALRFALRSLCWAA
jgi:hypothetical protein